ncbi:MAG TPA: hypothetical protein VEI02_07565 [Planctomycetota bacterium]|nr:hypothetical protein [Planctomycetota bacterium]
MSGDVGDERIASRAEEKTADAAPARARRSIWSSYVELSAATARAWPRHAWTLVPGAVVLGAVVRLSLSPIAAPWAPRAPGRSSAWLALIAAAAFGVAACLIAAIAALPGTEPSTRGRTGPRFDRVRRALRSIRPLALLGALAAAIAVLVMFVVAFPVYGMIWTGADALNAASFVLLMVCAPIAAAAAFAPWCLAPAACVTEGVGVLAALRRSAAATRGRRTSLTMVLAAGATLPYLHLPALLSKTPTPWLALFATEVVWTFPCLAVALAWRHAQRGIPYSPAAV